MKALRIGLFFLLGLIAFFVLVVALLFVPVVQKKLVTRLAGAGPEQHLEMEYMRVGVNGAVARDVVFTQRGATYRLEEFTSDLSLSSLIFRREARLGDVRISGLVVDLSSKDEESRRRRDRDRDEPFEGVLRQMELPMPVYLDEVRVEGVVLLPAAGAEPLRNEFLLTGGGLAPGKEAEFHLRGDVYDPSPEAAVSTMGLDGSLAVGQGAGGAIERARLLAQLSAAGGQLGVQDRLHADALLISTDEGESYQARLARVASEEDDQQPLVFLDAAYRHSDRSLQGSWEVRAEREQLTAFIGDLEVPAFAASGDGTFSYGMTGEVFAVQGQLDVRTGDLGAVLEELGQLGGFALTSRFDVALDEESFRMEELVLEVRDEEGESLLEARNFQPVRYDRRAGRLVGDAERLDLATVNLRGLPIEWGNLFLQADEGEEALVLGGEPLTGQLLVSAEGGAVLFRLSEPVRTRGFSIRRGEEWLARDLAVAVEASGNLRDGEFEAVLDRLRMDAGRQEMMVASGRYLSAGGEASGRLQVALPVALTQPVLAGSNNLRSGLLTADLTASFEERVSLEVAGQLSGLVTRVDRRRVPDVAFQVNVQESEGNVWEMEAPLRVEGEAPSDLHLAGTLEEGETGNRFQVNVQSDFLHLDDLMAISSAFSAPAESTRSRGGSRRSPPVPAEEPVRDEEPAWAGNEGEVRIELARIQLQGEQAIEQMAGEVQVEGATITGDLRGGLADGSVTVEGQLRFVPENDRPYLLEGTLEAPQLSATDLFRQIQPERPPTVEGVFDVSAEVRGDGLNIPDLLDRVRGQVAASSDGGIFRLLYSENPVAGAGMAIGSLLGNVSREVRSVMEVARTLSNVQFQELNLALERDEDLNFLLRDLTLVSPELHLRGVGEVRHRQGLEVLRQPMRVELQLGARGDLEQLLSRVRVLSDQRDRFGYRQMRREFAITGTPADPDNSAFYRFLMEAAMQLISPQRDGEEEGDSGIPGLLEGILRGDRR